MTRYLHATLTGTSNPDAGRLPMRGELAFADDEVDGWLKPTSFCPLLADGRLGWAVAIPDPVFTYTPAVDELVTRWRSLADRATAAGWAVSDGGAGQLVCPECGEPLALIATGRVGHFGDVCGTTQPFADDRPDCGDREALDEALRLAISDQGGAGAAIEDIEIWIGDNRSGGPVPRQAILARLAVLHDVRRIDAPASTKWFRTPAGDCPDCEGNGVNCLAHRDDAVGAAARSGNGS